MNKYWISFCDTNAPEGSQFLGAVIAAGANFTTALVSASLYGLHPGGNEQKGLMIEEDTYRLIPPRYLNRILDRTTCAEFDVEMNSLLEAKDESIKAVMLECTTMQRELLYHEILFGPLVDVSDAHFFAAYEALNHQADALSESLEKLRVEMRQRQHDWSIKEIKNDPKFFPFPKSEML